MRREGGGSTPVGHSSGGSLPRRLPILRPLEISSSPALQIVLFWAAVAILSALAAAAQSSPAGALLARQAAEAYGQGRYQEAAQLYTRYLSQGGEGAAARFDLGTCYLKAGDLGRAILELRRALKADPELAAAKQNLDVARRLLPARVAPWQPSPWEAALRDLPPNWLEWTVLFLSLLGNGGLAAATLLAPGRARRACAGLMVGAFIAAGVTGAFLAYARTVLPEHRPAVVLGPASVYPSPEAQGKPMAVLPAGSEVMQVAQAGDWTLVLWGEGRGWTSASAVEAP